MDEPTRKQALKKLAVLEARIGYPDKYADYSPVKIDPKDLLGNVTRTTEFAWKRQVSWLGHAVDRTLWFTTPQTMNGSYDLLTNQLTIAGASLQPPGFDPNADAAVNYGSVGALIGHELSHGFDDNGRHFDATGKVQEWFTPNCLKRFEEKAARVVSQYNEFEPLPGMKVNGELTLAENMADIGGLQIAYGAYRRYIARTGRAPVLSGLTGDQRFFLALAQSKRQKMREGRLREYLVTNSHSPAQVRINAVVRNVDAWYAAFDVKPDEKLYLPPEQRVRMW